MWWYIGYRRFVEEGKVWCERRRGMWRGVEGCVFLVSGDVE